VCRGGGRRLRSVFFAWDRMLAAAVAVRRRKRPRRAGPRVRGEQAARSR